MKIPLVPPRLETLEHKVKQSKSGLFSYFLLLENAQPTTPTGEYLHWDKLRHLKPIQGFVNAEEWWLATKIARKALYKALPFKDKNNKPFQTAMPDIIWQKLHDIDRSAGFIPQIETNTINIQTRDTYLARSLIEESITSSQLEGASTTTEIAKEMLRQGRKPRNHSEKMIHNNFQAMQFIQEIKKQDLTPKIIFELHTILTEDTLINPNAAGKFRKTTDDIHIVDAQGHQVLHTPPNANELNNRLLTLCKFANGSIERFFLHPIIKAIILHFILAYDHPFVDGNGRTARAIFYWYLAKQGYWLMEYISISSILKKSPNRYARAFLHTETDDNDLTYFILHQLDVILNAINVLQDYLAKKAEETAKIEQLIHAKSSLRNKLNYRQIALLEHALKHPNARYQIEAHRTSHKVTYDTARNDLLKLAKLKLLIKQKIGRAFIFIPSKDLHEKIKGH